MSVAVALFTVNTDIFSNPSIVNFLRGCIVKKIDIVIFSNSAQVLSPPSDLAGIKVISKPLYILKRKQSLKEIYNFLGNLFSIFKHVNRSQFIISIDPPGLVHSSQWKYLSLGGKKLIYWSFEIIFRDELGKIERAKKTIENFCSKSIDVLVIQDKVRLNLLLKENDIRQKIETFLIPVAPSKPLVQASEKNKGSKIKVLYSGTIGEWSGISKLIEIVKSNWDENFVLWIHSRNRLDPEDPTVRELRQLEAIGRVVLSDDYIKDSVDYLKFISKCDIGLVLYNPIFNGGGLGKNIENIGLSSGKFSSYLSVGKPVITSYDATYHELRKGYQFGELLRTYDDIIPLAARIKQDLENYQRGASELFSNVLDPNHTMDLLLNRINQLA